MATVCTTLAAGKLPECFSILSGSGPCRRTWVHGTWGDVVYKRQCGRHQGLQASRRLQYGMKLRRASGNWWRGHHARQNVSTSTVHSVTVRETVIQY